MAKFRVMATREDWLTITIEADSEKEAKRMIGEMSYEQLIAVDEQGEGDFHIDGVEEVT